MKNDRAVGSNHPAGIVGVISHPTAKPEPSDAVIMAAAPSAFSAAIGNSPTVHTDALAAGKDKLIDLPGVLRRVPIARSTIYEWIRRGVFPPGRRIGPRKRLWKESEIDDFVRGM